MRKSVFVSQKNGALHFPTFCFTPCETLDANISGALHSTASLVPYTLLNHILPRTIPLSTQLALPAPSLYKPLPIDTHKLNLLLLGRNCWKKKPTSCSTDFLCCG